MHGVSFHIGTEDQDEEVVEFLNTHFLPWEPMNISIGLISPGYKIPFFDAMVKRHLRMEDTLVILARDEEDNQILGLAVFINEKRWKSYRAIL